jgi:uncharacterized protein
MNMFQWVILVLGAAAGGLVQGITGFAFAMIAMSVWIWALDPVTAGAMAVFGGLTGQIVSALTVRRGWCWPMSWPFLAGAVVGITIGGPLVALLNPSAFRTILGGLLVIFCSAMLLSERLPSIQKGGRLGDAAAGLLGGIMALLGGFSGLAPALWCTLRGYDKDDQRAVVQNFNLAVLASTMAYMIYQGKVNQTMLPSMGLVAVSLLIPSFLGAKLYIGMTAQTFRKVVLKVLVLAGVIILVREAVAFL